MLAHRPGDESAAREPVADDAPGEQIDLRDGRVDAEVDDRIPAGDPGETQDLIRGKGVVGLPGARRRAIAYVPDLLRGAAEVGAVDGRAVGGQARHAAAQDPVEAAGVHEEGGPQDTGVRLELDRTTGDEADPVDMHLLEGHRSGGHGVGLQPRDERSHVDGEAGVLGHGDPRAPHTDRHRCGHPSALGRGGWCHVRRLEHPPRDVVDPPSARLAERARVHERRAQAVTGQPGGGGGPRRAGADDEDVERPGRAHARRLTRVRVAGR
jgi:hypothetical protein